MIGIGKLLRKDNTMNEHELWFSTFRETKQLLLHFMQEKPIAYFCIEYALSDSLPTYAGGLGILAADYVRELADQKIPAVAVGLLYHRPYGTGEEATQPLQLPQTLTPVLDQENKPLLVEVPIQDHTVFAKAWLWQEGTIPVYLLDTNTPENNTADKEITKQLYSADRESRLKQEMILGI